MSSVVFQGTATSNQNLFDLIRQHLTTTALGASVTASGSNVGNGGVTGIIFKTTSTPQTFTLTCTAAAANSGTFSVSGSTIGAIGNATVGAPFDHAQIGFTIADGATDFVIGDVFTVATVPWVENRTETEPPATGFSNVRNSLLRAPGLSNTDQIYIQLRVFDRPGVDTFTLQINGAINFNPNESYQNQPNISPDTFLALWQNPIPYILIANGRRFILRFQIATVFGVCYNGFILPQGTSSEYPYPLFISGNVSNAQRYSINSYELSNFWKGYPGNSFYHNLDGSWEEVSSITGAGGTPVGQSQGYNCITPYNNSEIHIGNNSDDSFGLIQPRLIIRKNTQNDRLEGVFEGLQYVSGFNNASGDVIQISNYENDFIVTQNTSRTNISEYAAIELG